MTSGTDPNPVIAGVLQTLRQARTLLLDPSPRNIDHCRVAIFQCVQRVVSVMEGDRSAWNNNGPNKNELKNSLLEIRSQLTAIAGLLDSAAAFRRGMLKATSGATRHLVADLDPTSIQTARRVHLLG